MFREACQSICLLELVYVSYVLRTLISTNKLHMYNEYIDMDKYIYIYIKIY